MNNLTNETELKYGFDAQIDESTQTTPITQNMLNSGTIKTINCNRYANSKDSSNPTKKIKKSNDDDLNLMHITKFI